MTGKLYSLEADLRAQLLTWKIKRLRAEDRFMQMRADLYDLRAELALIDHNIEHLLDRLKVYDEHS